MTLRSPASRLRAAPFASGRDRHAAIEAGIRRYSSACGCELGALFMIGATVAFFAYVTVASTTWSPVETWWRGGLWVLSLSVVGKLLGLAYARVRLQMLRSAQRAEFGSSTPG